ncbi:hypothetical protein A5655_12435 [Mycobacterium sp. 1081908.1]|nr:hypothetical protein A5655_12435 [Mycobacterium sp. 1081908.1]
MLSGSGIGSAAPDSGPTAGPARFATSMTSRSRPASRSARPAAVIAAVGAASSSMNSIRAAGTAGSIGTYAAPVLSTARIATIASADRGNNSATRCPGPIPWPASRCANRSAACSTSR